MIGLYYKEGIKWLDWEDKYDYLVTRYKMIYYYGKIPDRVKDYYLTDEGVHLVRVFMQRLYKGNFYLKIERWNNGHVCYNYYLGLDSLSSTPPFLTTCAVNKSRYFEAYWFKHIVEYAVNHYIGEGEAIAGAILENFPFKLVSHSNDVGVRIDISSTYLTIAIDDVMRLMKGRNRITSVTWANRKIIMINDLPIEEI